MSCGAGGMTGVFGDVLSLLMFTLLDGNGCGCSGDGGSTGAVGVIIGDSGTGAGWVGLLLRDLLLG